MDTRIKVEPLSSFQPRPAGASPAHTWKQRVVFRRARIWLEEPKKRFDRRTPLEMLRTETGGRLVEEFLVQIDEGMFA